MGKVRTVTEEEQKAIVEQMVSQQEQNQKIEQPKTNGLPITHIAEKEMPKNWQNTGRNEKCHCGSGKSSKTGKDPTSSIKKRKLMKVKTSNIFT